jgi:hypothetical protein
MELMKVEGNIGEGSGTLRLHARTSGNTKDKELPKI